VRETLARLTHAYTGYYALGHEQIEHELCRAIRNDAAPSIYDANHLQRVRARTQEELDAVFGFLEQTLGARRHREVLVDPGTPERLVARLALDGYEPEPTVQLLLAGPLAGPAPTALDVRPAESEEDWRAVRALLRLDHEETCERRGRPVYDERVTDQMAFCMRGRSPASRHWLVREGTRDVAFFASWPGEDGIGVVEDLFTHPDCRGRGIARALIHHAVADARARGAEQVLIGADPSDWPKKFYAALGFEAKCVTWAWLRTPD
jgi:ribosomal protein S18 acetylase RimI-like enzyme